MATITQRKGKQGLRYTAQIRMRKDGVQHSESKTFDTKAAAKAWGRKREAELEEYGFPDRYDGMTVAEGCLRYLADLRASPRGVGRSKAQTLEAMGRHPDLTGLLLSKATAADWLAYLLGRLEGRELPDGRVIKAGPARVKDDFSYLAVMLDHAKVAWGMRVDAGALEDAGAKARKMGVLAQAVSRDVRPTVDQLDQIMDYWLREYNTRGRLLTSAMTEIPMLLVVPFLIFSTRRLSEVTRIRWSDLDRPRRRVLVRDMKHPRKKVGNDVWVHLPPRAMAIIDRMPQVAAEIFPYASSSVRAQFEKAVKWAKRRAEEEGRDFGPHIRLHDLRHEGISHYFELGYDIPRVAMISGHKTWSQLEDYTHLIDIEHFDKYADWRWVKHFELPPHDPVG